MNMKASVARNSMPTLFAAVVIIIIWQLWAVYVINKEYLLPSPNRILAAAAAHTNSLTKDSILTLSEAVMGLGLASLVAFCTAFAFQINPAFRKAFFPFVIASKSVPIVIFAPLFALWFGYGPSGKVVLSAIVAFLPIVVNTTSGMDAVSKEQLDVFTLHGATKWQTLWKLRLPNAVPFVLPALRLSATLAVLGVVIAEMTGAKAGLGATILICSATQDTPLLFAAAGCALVVCAALLVMIKMSEVVALRRFRYRVTEDSFSI